MNTEQRMSVDTPVPDTNNNKITRIWCDGCYDMAHFGHANSLRQAKERGDYLVVGVHSDKEIAEHKSCPPVFTSQERYEMIRGIKWVDQVVEAAPYVTTLETLDKYGCQYCAHGNDITTTADGKDTYQAVKDAGRYLEVERTQGVSTTKLIERMLKWGSKDDADENAKAKSSYSSSFSPYTGTSYLPTTRKISQFADSNTPPRDGKIVYVDGTFDVFHPGHLAFLKKAKEHGDFLIVGVYDDNTISSLKGKYPIMNLLERVQCILACRYVNEVVIGCPLIINSELLDHFNISLVLHGKVTPIRNGIYKEPIERGIFQVIKSGSDLTTEKVVERVIGNRFLYEKRNKDKQQKEMDLLQNTTNSPSNLQEE